MTNDTRTPAINATINMSNPLNGELTLAFSHGDSLRVSMSMLSPEIATQCMMHGLKQKLVDAAAISRNPDTGRSATIEDKYDAVREVYERLLAGQWNKGRADGSVTKGGLLFRALCMMYADKSPEAIKAFLDKKTPAEKTALRNTQKIADIIATLKADDTEGEIDTDSMLDELNS